MNGKEKPTFGDAKRRSARAPARSGRLYSGLMDGGPMVRRIVFSTIVLFCMGLGDVAVAAVPPGGASQFIRQIGDRAIATLRAPDAGLAAREARFRSLLSEGFDLAFIGRFVLGRYWRQATPEQRSDYLVLFGEYVLQTYSARLGATPGRA